MHTILHNMSITRTMGQRLERVTEVLNQPIVRPADRNAVGGKCLHCQTAYHISREAYTYILKRLTRSTAMDGNTDLKVRHKIVDLYPIRGAGARRYNYKVAYESELDVYSHDHKCYTLMIGLRSIQMRDRCNTLCSHMTVEVDIPYRKEAPIPLQGPAERIAYGLANNLINSCNKGSTALDHWENERAGRYKVTMEYAIFSEAIPIEDGYTRLGVTKNNFTAGAAVPAGPSIPNEERPIRIDTATQTRDDHEVQILPEEEQNPQRRSGKRSYLDTVLQ